ncbi:30S ribosomal protein S16 [Patescibacteria group bacterium]
MLKIRLTRTGKKHDPHYRIIVMPARTKRDGRAVEYIGYYNPRSKEIKLKVERAKHWLSVGAQPTDTVRSILVKHKLLKQLPRPKREPKKPKKEMKKEAAGKDEKTEPKKKPKQEKKPKKESKKNKKPEVKKEPKVEKKLEKKEEKKK